jgi:hypothetical protein
VGVELCQVVDGLEKAAPPLDPQSATMLDYPPAERFIPLTAFRLTQHRQRGVLPPDRAKVHVSIRLT